MALTPDDLHGASSSTKRFLQSLHEDALGSDDTGGQKVALNAGLNYLSGKHVADTFMHTDRFGGLDADRAADFGKDAQAAVNAIGAPAGSIAARSDPNQYGTVASREFKDTFGPGKTDDLQLSVGSDPTNRGLARRALTQSFGG